jgi:hypothetical protein
VATTRRNQVAKTPGIRSGHGGGEPTISCTSSLG